MDYCSPHRQTSRQKLTLDHVPLALMKSLALLYNVPQQPYEMQCLVQLWDPAYKPILNKEVRAFLQKLLKPTDADLTKATTNSIKDHLLGPIKDYLLHH